MINMKIFSLQSGSKFNIFSGIQLHYTRFDISEYIFAVIDMLAADVLRKIYALEELSWGTFNMATSEHPVSREYIFVLPQDWLQNIFWGN